MKEVNNTYWDDEHKLLITTGNDKRFKVKYASLVDMAVTCVLSF